MLQKCGYNRVLEVFFKEPTKVHFIRGISKNINLATTSVKKYIDRLSKENLIIQKESGPFKGYIANREEDKFIFYKQIYNLYSLYELKTKIILEIGPQAIVLFGSYQKGEDIEGSDIDLAIFTKIKKEINVKKFEDSLNRHVHITYIENINKIEKNLQENLRGGWIIYGKI